MTQASEDLWKKFWDVEDEMEKVSNEIEMLMLQKEVELSKLRIKQLQIKQQIIQLRLNGGV